jgi:type III secretion protein L
MASKIIKGEVGVEPAPERPVVRTARPGVLESGVYDAHQKAKDIIADAEQQAADLLARAKEEHEAVVAAAKEAGRQEGLAQITEMLLKAKQERAAIVEGAEPQIVQLALTVAEKIIGHAVQLDEDVILSMAAQAIETVRQQHELVLRVHPDDANLLRNSRKKLLDMLGRTKDIAVREDSEIQRGGCIIETENGTVDAQLRTQLQVLEQLLLGDRKG